MRQKQGVFSLFLRSPSSRRAWIEIQPFLQNNRAQASPSSRRAWIEIALLYFLALAWLVALLAEGVDRNTQTAKRVKNINVVALLAEGVDRNEADARNGTRYRESPSSRRAWIEI